MRNWPNMRFLKCSELTEPLINKVFTIAKYTQDSN